MIPSDCCSNREEVTSDFLSQIQVLVLPNPMAKYSELEVRQLVSSLFFL